MPTFRYIAYQQTGAVVDGTVEASSVERALEVLWERGLTPLETHEQSYRTGPARSPFLLSKAVSRRDVAAFTRELATLAQADIPLDDSLRIISDQANATRMRPVLAALLQDVLDGAYLSESMSRHPKVFPGDYVSLIKAGEMSGRLAHGATELADLLDRRLELAGKFTSALIYPMILIVVAMMSVTIVIGVLVPAVAPVFNESGRAMPAVISLLLALQRWWPIILGVAAILVGLFLGIGALALRSSAVRATASRLLLALPVLGMLVKERNVARFTRTLGALLRAGVPLMAAFSSACSVVKNQHIASTFEAAIEELRDGRSLTKALSQSQSIPSAAMRMIAVGEEVGKLDQMLLRSAIMMEQQNHRRIERLMTLLTPALTVGLAIFVGMLVLTIMNAVLAVNELAIG